MLYFHEQSNLGMGRCKSEIYITQTEPEEKVSASWFHDAHQYDKDNWMWADESPKELRTRLQKMHVLLQMLTGLRMTGYQSIRTCWNTTWMVACELQVWILSQLLFSSWQQIITFFGNRKRKKKNSQHSIFIRYTFENKTLSWYILACVWLQGSRCGGMTQVDVRWW